MVARRGELDRHRDQAAPDRVVAGVAVPGLEMSALVVTQDAGMPGAGFWVTCVRTQNVRRNADERLFEYAQILNEVYATDWPTELP